MASSPTETYRFASFDGVRLAWRALGAGRPVVLLHGYFSDAATNWLRYGHAGRIAAAGRRVILPDLRAHGQSERPHDPAAYPPDVLARDGHALVAHLGLAPGGYDLGGYSLGARTAVRMAVTGAMPGRLVVGGMGLAGLTDTGARAAYFRRVLTGLGGFARGSPEWLAEGFLRTTGGDPVALARLLASFVDTPAALLAGLDRPTLVVAGVDDGDNGSTADLAALLPRATHAAVPGNHMSAVLKPALGEAIAGFLR